MSANDAQPGLPVYGRDPRSTDARSTGRDDLYAPRDDVDVEVDADDLDRDHAELASDPLDKTDSTGGTTEPPD